MVTVWRGRSRCPWWSFLSSSLRPAAGQARDFPIQRRLVRPPRRRLQRLVLLLAPAWLQSGPLKRRCTFAHRLSPATSAPRESETPVSPLYRCRHSTAPAATVTGPVPPCQSRLSPGLFQSPRQVRSSGMDAAVNLLRDVGWPVPSGRRKKRRLSAGPRIHHKKDYP